MAILESLGYNPCLLAQFSLDSKFRGLDPGATQSDVGTLTALLSSQNRNAVSFNPLPDRAAPVEDGKVKLTASFLPFICDTSESETPVTKCDVSGGALPNYLYADYVIDNTTTQKWTLNDDQFRNSCETPGQQFDDMFLRNVDAFLRKVNKKSIVEALTYMGDYPQNGQNSVLNPIAIPVIDPQKLYNSQSLAYVKSLYMKMQLGSINPIITGAGLLDYAMAGIPIAGVADDGVRGRTGWGLENYFRDSQIDTVSPDASGLSRMLTWAPGALQLLTWIENTGPNGYSTELTRLSGYDGIATSATRFEKQFLPLNINGLMVDFFYTYDCNGNHSFALQLKHSVVAIPPSAFAACQNYNYALNFLQECGTMDCLLFNGGSPT